MKRDSIMQILTFEEPPRAPAPAAWALWALGFRPFYLVAALFGAISIALWALQFTGWLPHPYLEGPLWHAHEMLFGFTLAVIVGFLFTAGRNWTNQPTPTGWRLGALVALWLAARILVVTPYATAAAVANVAFPLACAIALAVPFWRARNKRNYFFVGLLLVMSVAAAMVHLQRLRGMDAAAWSGVQVALDVVLFILVVMGGRVIPMFTNNSVAGADAQRTPRLDKVALGAVLALLAADALGAPAWLVGTIAVVAGGAHAARLAYWHPFRTRRTPLVWVLHLAYAWIPVHLVLRACAAAGVVSTSAATHALTVGAIGGLIIGMVTRTAKGHTGRALRADRWDTVSYLLVAAAAGTRVLVPLFVPALTITAIGLTAVLWCAALGLYVVRYLPVLTRARLDGKPG